MKNSQIALIVILVIIIAIGATILLTRHGSTPAHEANVTTNTTIVKVTNTTETTSNTTKTSSTNVSNSTNKTNVTEQNGNITKLPPGAVRLNYNQENHTAFVYLYASPTASNPLNYNGTTDGQLKIYVPENWSIYFTFYNPEPIGHALAVVQNNTPIPNQLQLSQDGKIIFEIGYNGGNGISGGLSVSGLLPSLPPGLYWIACPISGHAESGMWSI